MAVEARDPATGRHAERVADLVGRMAARLGWSAPRIAALRQAALLHDVGKIGVPDTILLKPGPLTPEEYDRVKPHAELGASILAEVIGPEQTSWVRHHHERFDGHGYPGRPGGRPDTRGRVPDRGGRRVRRHDHREGLRRATEPRGEPRGDPRACRAASSRRGPWTRSRAC